MKPRSYREQLEKTKPDLAFFPGSSPAVASALPVSPQPCLHEPSSPEGGKHHQTLTRSLLLMMCLKEQKKTGDRAAAASWLKG